MQNVCSSPDHHDRDHDDDHDCDHDDDHDCDHNHARDDDDHDCDHDHARDDDDDDDQGDDDKCDTWHDQLGTWCARQQSGSTPLEAPLLSAEEPCNAQFSDAHYIAHYALCTMHRHQCFAKAVSKEETKAPKYQCNAQFSDAHCIALNYKFQR